MHPNSLLGSKFKERPVKRLCHILHMSNSFLGKFIVYNFAGNNIITPSAAGISSCGNIKLLEYQASGISSCWNIKLLEYQAAGISSCWNIKLLEYQAAGISSCWNIKLLEYQAAGISSCWNSCI